MIYNIQWVWALLYILSIDYFASIIFQIKMEKYVKSAKT